MTQQEQALADDKMRAEIAKLLSETAKLAAETTRIGADETARIGANEKVRAETAKLLAETRQVGINTLLAPFLAAAALMGATAALVKLLLF